MALSLQVAYPVGDSTTFDHAYYTSTHMPLVGQHMGAFIQGTSIGKGLAGGGPDAPAPFHVIATMTFADQAGLDGALAAAGPVIADIANFTNSAPQMMVGEVIS